MLNRYKVSSEEENVVVLGIVAQQCELFNAAELYTLKGRFCFVYLITVLIKIKQFKRQSLQAFW